MKTNTWTRFRALTPEPTLDVGTVEAHLADGTSRVTLITGREVFVAGQTVAIGARAFVRGDQLIGAAPDLLVIDIVL